MCGEIGDHQQAARPRRAGRFGQYAGGIFRVVQDHLEDDEIETAIRQRQTVHVCETDGAMREAGATETGAGQGEHVAAGIDAEGGCGARSQQFQQAAGAGADV